VIDLGISKMALIGAVALIVIGPEKLPRVARTVGTLLGKAQRYVADVKAEVNRSMELDELKKMKETVEGAARDVENSIHTGRQRLREILGRGHGRFVLSRALPGMAVFPEYKHPKKKWRLKQGATPQWYKARSGVRTRALSGAARVARTVRSRAACLEPSR
jgi:sec-independent protein translocase protein TatB